DPATSPSALSRAPSETPPAYRRTASAAPATALPSESTPDSSTATRASPPRPGSSRRSPGARRTPVRASRSGSAPHNPSIKVCLRRSSCRSLLSQSEINLLQRAHRAEYPNLHRPHLAPEPFRDLLVLHFLKPAEHQDFFFVRRQPVERPLQQRHILPLR